MTSSGSSTPHLRPKTGGSWVKWGFRKNPFPDSGVSVEQNPDVFFDAHMRANAARVQRWLEEVLANDATQWNALALKGSIGVGKSHLLRRIQLAVQEYSRSQLAGDGERAIASYVTLHDRGTPILGDHLLELLRASLPDSEGSLLREIVRGLRAGSPGDLHLPAGDVSPLDTPLRRIIEASEDESDTLVHLLEDWLAGQALQRAELQALGVRGRISSEGEAVRVFAHLVRLGRKFAGVRVWVILVDQLEDLWRPEMVTALRRARFLTDMRMLVDLGLEGSPVAVVLGWNTDVLEGHKRGRGSVEERFKLDYKALWTRVQANIVDVPPLKKEHLLAFAGAYIQDAEREEGAALKFVAQLAGSVDEILATLPPEGRLGEDVVERFWLQALSQWAEALVEPARRTNTDRF